MGEKAREGTEMRSGICWVLKEDQYLNSGVCFRVLGFDFNLGLTGNVLDSCGSAIERSSVDFSGLGF